MDAVPVIARGHHAAVFVPPVPRALAPLLAAVPPSRHPVLLIASSAERALDIATGVDLPGFAVAGGVAPSSPYPGDRAGAVIGASDALDLVKASALHAAAFGCVVLAWPEELDEDSRAALEAVMAECDKDSQRVIATTETGEPTRVLIERYAFKAMTFGFPPAGSVNSAPEPPVGPARYVLAGTSSVRRTLLQLQGILEPGVAISACPLSREEAASLAGARPPVLVLTPEELPWARSLFQPLAPFPVPGRLSALDRRTARLREKLDALAGRGGLDRELLVLAPLLERHDPAVLAAAALRLAGESGAVRAAVTADATVSRQDIPAYTRIWVGIGRKDNVRPGDLVGALAKEVGLPADAIGKIETRDLFCLVEVRSDQAERAARGLTGVTIRGRRLSARVDRGPGAGGRPPRRS